MKAVLRFKFPEGTEKVFIEATMASAIFNAECVFGKPRVRVSGVGYHIADDSRQCVIDVSSEVGEHVAQVFTGIMMNVLGEDKFHVTRIDAEAASRGPNRPS